MTTPQQARAFAQLFAGRDDAYGVAKGKVERGHVGQRFYQDHLSGLVGADIGIFPVRDDGTVMFAAVDIDEPNLGLAIEVCNEVPGCGWIERSRSGNYHVFAFFDKPLPAWAARSVLRATCLMVGRPDLEVFPKQDSLKEGMLGNYISLPLYGHQRPIIYASGDQQEREEYELDTFLISALTRTNSADYWERRARALGGRPREERQASEFGTRTALHICASYIYDGRETNPIGVGHRHTVLFNVAKMYANCRAYSESETLEIVEEINRHSTVPLSDHDLSRMVGNAFRGQFTSTGCDDPLMSPYVSPDCRIASGQ